MKDRPMPLTSNRKKLEHFWYYYKIHTFIAIFIGFFIIMTIRDVSQNIEADVSWGFMGMDLTAEQHEALLQEWLPLIKDANEDGEKHIRLYSLSDPQQIMVMMVAGDTQIFSFDLESFSNFAKGGAFLPLDELIAVNEIDLEKFPEVRLTAQETSEEHVYGLPLEENRFLNNLGLRSEGKFLGLRIPKNTVKPAEKIANDNASAIMQHLFSFH